MAVRVRTREMNARIAVEKAERKVIEAAKAQELTYAAYVQTGVGAWKEAYRDKCADTCHAVAELLAAEGEE